MDCPAKKLFGRLQHITVFGTGPLIIYFITRVDQRSARRIGHENFKNLQILLWALSPNNELVGLSVLARRASLSIVPIKKAYYHIKYNNNT